VPEDWQILNMGYHFHSTYVVSPIYYKYNHESNVIGTHAIAYKNDSLNIILHELDTCTYPFDIFLSRRIYNKFNTYVASEKIFYQSSYRSYEGDKDASYKKYISAIDDK
jgi:hypothetical protein